MRAIRLRTRMRWLALASLAPASACFALTLGDAELRSALDEPLDARIALTVSRGEAISGSCFALAAPASGAPALGDASLALRRSAHGAYLQVQTARAAVEPAITFAVAVGCPGKPRVTTAFSLLLDPRPLAGAEPSRHPSTTSLATLRAASGDTLASLARTIHPGDPAAGGRYLRALRASNPTLAAHGNDAPIALDAPIVLPELRTVAAVRRSLPRREQTMEDGRAARFARPAPAAKPSDGFQLKLSAPVIDLGPSRHVDEATRVQLRERLVLLDGDDQVAAMLAMRNSLRQLEARVNELQLKLAQMPASFAASSPAAPAVAPAPVAARVSTSTSGSGPARGPQRARVVPSPPARERMAPPWLEETAPLLGLGVLLVALLIFMLRRRARSADAGYADESGVASAMPPPTEPAAGAPAPEEREVVAPAVADEGERRRQRYVEERFPEILNGTLVMDEPESVVNSARLLYEDGATARAIELLQLATERRPEEVRPWLALFEIFRLERLDAEFAQLARRFRERHADAPEWRKVQFFGREIDPANGLYREDALAALETIGTAPAARRAGLDAFDPATENWLLVPVDFANEALAVEMRQALMRDACVTERDLRADPATAPRDAESFTVA